jgi:hypothetical protein
MGTDMRRMWRSRLGNSGTMVTHVKERIKSHRANVLQKARTLHGKSDRRQVSSYL